MFCRVGVVAAVAAATTTITTITTIRIITITTTIIIIVVLIIVIIVAACPRVFPSFALCVAAMAVVVGCGWTGWTEEAVHSCRVCTHVRGLHSKVKARA